MNQIDNIKYSFMGDFRTTPFGYYYTDELGNNKFYSYKDKPLFWYLQSPWEHPLWITMEEKSLVKQK